MHNDAPLLDAGPLRVTSHSAFRRNLALWSASNPVGLSGHIAFCLVDGPAHTQYDATYKAQANAGALGEWPTISIDDAKAAAHRLCGLTEKGTDPREGERQPCKGNA